LRRLARLRQPCTDAVPKWGDQSHWKWDAIVPIQNMGVDACIPDCNQVVLVFSARIIPGSWVHSIEQPGIVLV
jgi:hypothetical protein